MIYTFTAQGTSDQVQAVINASDAMLEVRVPWQHTRGFENVVPGDGAVIECSDPGCKCCWIGDVEDVEFEEGYDLQVLVSIR